jgi:branched-chain amino acid transport system permease protein
VLEGLRRRPRLAFVLLACLLASLPFLMGLGLGNSWVRVLDFVLLYILLAIGLNIVVGYAGLLDLGYIAFYALGAYLYAWLASRSPSRPDGRSTSTPINTKNANTS